MLFRSLDHVLVMVAVGLFAAQLGERALWLVPLAFLSMMVAGGALAAGGVDLPLVEVAIALSVVVLGIAVAIGWRMPIAAAMALAGVFAIFHGHAHAAEMAHSVSGLEYGFGFVLATAMMHGAGIGLGLSVGRLGEASGRRILRLAGSAMAVAGVAFLAGYG